MNGVRPHRLSTVLRITTCTAEQIITAARDFEPNHFRAVHDRQAQQAAGSPAGCGRPCALVLHAASDQRRAYSEETATNIDGEPMAQRWGNWAKIFFNNKGIAAKETDNCANHPLDDASVWDG
jgi:hypothetical protein